MKKVLREELRVISYDPRKHHEDSVDLKEAVSVRIVYRTTDRQINMCRRPQSSALKLKVGTVNRCFGIYSMKCNPESKELTTSVIIMDEVSKHHS